MQHTFVFVCCSVFVINYILWFLFTRGEGGVFDTYVFDFKDALECVHFSLSWKIAISPEEGKRGLLCWCCRSHFVTLD